MSPAQAERPRATSENLARVRVLFRQSDLMSLWGIPYEMRPGGQQPRDIDERWRDDWIWLGQPGWFGSMSADEIATTKEFLAKHTDEIPRGPNEWTTLGRSNRAMKSAKVTPSPERFATLRAKYIEKRDARNTFEREIRWKYGDNRWSTAWIGRDERTKLERLRSAADKAASAFYDYLAEISPRDWSYGVPVHWLYESLTYEDAIRPTTESLSVVPPLSHGATEHRT